MRTIIEQAPAPTRVRSTQKPWARAQTPADDRRRNGPVVVTFPPVGEWGCDACPETGTGKRAHLDHFEATGHRVVTAVR